MKGVNAMKGIIQYSHELLTTSIKKGELAIDATCGNGNDTLVLSELVGDDGRVLAFDVQEQAIHHTKELLNKHEITNVQLIHDSHAHINKYLHGTDQIGGAIFNLGYLPRSNKEIITQGETTVHALKEILQNLKINGITVLVVYHGHEGGKEEKQTLLEYVIQLNQRQFQVLRYGYINQKNNPPFIVAIKKLAN